MRTVELKKINNSENLLKSTPLKKHYNKLITKDTKFYLNNECIGIYLNIDKERLRGQIT